MQFFTGIPRLVFLVVGLLWLSGCSPEVGSDKWCAEMKEKPKQDWTARETADYAKYCVFKLKKE